MILASFWGTVGTVALVLAAAAYGVMSYFETRCQFCGFTKNKWKSQFPVCQQCGRNRVTGGAGPAHH